MHNALVSSNNHTFDQALLGRQFHLLPPLEGGYNGDLDIKGQHNLAHVREIVAVATIEATPNQRSFRGDKRNQIVAEERSDHKAGDFVDIWYDLPNEDTPDWRGPAHIASANGGEGDIIVRFQGGILDRRYQEECMHVPYSVYIRWS